MLTDILTHNQITFLTAVGESALFMNRFYLTGGTPLAAFYLKHRYSEDLDFFSEEELEDIAALEVAIREIQKKVSADAIDFQKSFFSFVQFFSDSSNNIQNFIIFINFNKNRHFIHFNHLKL